VLAADSRGTFGDPNSVTAQNDSQQKAHILSPHVAVTAAGHGEVGALLIHEAKNAISQGSMDGVTAVMPQVWETLSNFVRRLVPAGCRNPAASPSRHEAGPDSTRRKLRNRRIRAGVLLLWRSEPIFPPKGATIVGHGKRDHPSQHRGGVGRCSRRRRVCRYADPGRPKRCRSKRSERLVLGGGWDRVHPGRQRLATLVCSRASYGDLRSADRLDQESSRAASSPNHDRPGSSAALTAHGSLS
jgi:hypothetical protein